MQLFLGWRRGREAGLPWKPLDTLASAHEGMHADGTDQQKAAVASNKSLSSAHRSVG